MKFLLIMKYSVIVVVALYSLTVSSYPIPAGQIIKYSLPSKYFNRSNSTANSLYDVLSQIHYGGKGDATSKVEQPVDQTTEVTTIFDEIVKVKDVATTLAAEMDVTDSNESLETTPSIDIDYVTSPQQLEINAAMKDNPIDNDETIKALIEQVVNEQIEKLASVTDTETKTDSPSDVIENTDLADESDAISHTVVAPTNDDDKVIETTTDISSEKEEVETTTAVSVIESDMENVAVEQQQEETTEKVSTAETSDNNFQASDALIGAIGDLLSSVLSVPIKILDETEHIHTTTIAPVEAITEASVEQSTEQDASTAASTDESAELMPTSNVNTNEIDLKIENLANVHAASFVTENTPEVYAETVKEDILEAQPAEEATTPVEFQESVNHVMSLVRGTEENRLALENAENIVDSVLIDHKAITDNVSQMINGALKEIETNFSVRKEIEETAHAVEMADRDREEMIRNFETDINESLTNPSDEDDNDDFLPNMAKAALFNRFQYDADDFVRK